VVLLVGVVVLVVNHSGGFDSNCNCDSITECCTDRREWDCDTQHNLNRDNHSECHTDKCQCNYNTQRNLNRNTSVECNGDAKHHLHGEGDIQRDPERKCNGNGYNNGNDYTNNYFYFN
jgi:hypothetical protein